MIKRKSQKSVTSSLLAGVKKPTQQKYRSKKTIINGIEFDSKKEARRYALLLILEGSGQISDLMRQVKIELAPAVVMDGRKRPAIRYYADFTYTENGKLVVEDVKSDCTRKLPVYRIKKHLAALKGIFINEV